MVVHATYAGARKLAGHGVRQFPRSVSGPGVADAFSLAVIINFPKASLGCCR